MQDLQRAVSQGAQSPSSTAAGGAEPERKVSRVELALTWASDLRLRLQLLLSLAGDTGLHRRGHLAEAMPHA